MSIEENKAIARRWAEGIWSKGNLVAIDELLAPDFVFNYPIPGAAPDREGYKQTVNENFVGFSDVRFTVEDMIAEGDKVMVHWTWNGTHTGEFSGIPPTGKQVTSRAVSIIRIEGGKIVEEVYYGDDLEFMQQLGMVPSPEQG